MRSDKDDGREDPRKQGATEGAGGREDRKEGERTPVGESAEESAKAQSGHCGASVRLAYEARPAGRQAKRTERIKDKSDRHRSADDHVVDLPIDDLVVKSARVLVRVCPPAFSSVHRPAAKREADALMV